MVKSPLSHSNSKLQQNPNPVNPVNPVKKKRYSAILHVSAHSIRLTVCRLSPPLHFYAAKNNNDSPPYQLYLPLSNSNSNLELKNSIHKSAHIRTYQFVKICDDLWTKCGGHGVSALPTLSFHSRTPTQNSKLTPSPPSPYRQK